MAALRIVKEWIQKADEDFYFAKSCLQEGRPYYAQICFHFHQAAEKYLKSYKDTWPSPRGQDKRHFLPTVLAIAAGGVLCGMRSYNGIWDWADWKFARYIVEERNAH
jgi:hypothetical protein